MEEGNDSISMALLIIFDKKLLSLHKVINLFVVVMASYYNGNEILAVRLIPSDQLLFKYSNTVSVEFDRIFNHADFCKKKLLTVAYYTQDGKYRSITDNQIVSSFDAILAQEDAGIRLLFDPETISFSSQPKRTRSGTIYTNTLKYSLPKMSESDVYDLQEELNDMRSGRAFHLLMQFRDCAKAFGVCLCPYPHAFSAEIEDSIERMDIKIVISNLSSHQWIR